MDDASASHQPVRLTSLSHGGGCGCKISPAGLSAILAEMPIAPGFAALLDANGVPNGAILAGLVWGLIEGAQEPPVIGIPEPAALVLFGFGLAGLAGLRRAERR